MVNKETISKEECEKCRQVKEIFVDFIEDLNDFCVSDAYPFCYIVLEWFDKEQGFSNQNLFYTASDLFDYLLDYWKRTTIYHMISEAEDLDPEQALEQLTEEQRAELKDGEREYMMAYEQVAILWDTEMM
ncbi:MAG: hypothetical protein EOM34_12890 [Clostridia bacterium]|uniref:Uncharacterized protein n=1 Tax=Hespellia stercorisuis DSM 15480 TaxID=1121950 RepID=A0A1M6TIR5_9FIRM|nr:hypothetical protein [Hespellia stercorisuis]MDD3184575.1 hypothetical protein [Anaerostipes sp.]NCC01548.1 hypothetical protein [Clostridia bacterium]SHK56861.1 hypothetical protein SAMN02745243_03240 [Hespellia stercorisuis DSM 15480]